MIQSKLKCVHTNKTIKGTGYHLDILIAGREIFAIHKISWKILICFVFRYTSIY